MRSLIVTSLLVIVLVTISAIDAKQKSITINQDNQHGKVGQHIQDNIQSDRVFIETYRKFGDQLKRNERPMFQIPAGWELVSHQQRSVEVKTITIALKQRNLKEAEDLAKLVSTPRTKHFRRYMSRDQLTEWISPTAQTVNRVTKWLASAGVTDVELNPSKDFLIVRGPAEAIGKLLDVEFKLYEHLAIGARVLRAEELYTVPSDIAPLIDYIGGVNRFPKIKTRTLMREPIIPRTDEDFVGLPEDNSPIIASVIPGDGEISTFVLIRCHNGNITTNEQMPCADNAPSLASVTTRVADQLEVAKVVAAPLASLDCRQCINWSGKFNSRSFLCNRTVNQHNLPNTAVFCSLPLVGDIRNYLPIKVSVSSVYSDSSSSSPTAYPSDVYTGLFVTPQILQRYYNIFPEDGYRDHVNNSQAVAEFLGQYYAPSDLTQFFQIMGQPSYPVNVIGPNDPSNPGGEASLDIQYIMGIAQNTTTTFWSLGELHDGQEPFDQWMTQVLNAPDVALVHSISYGDDENSLSQEFMTRVNAEFYKAALLGITLVFSSGDNGVASDNSTESGESCPNNHWVPSFPASSPWVTTVGATQFSTQVIPACSMSANGVAIRCDHVGEIMSSTTTGSRISSGGGFSDVFPRPTYQDQVVEAYINSTLQDIPSGWFSPGGRAYPDVAACGRNYVVVIGGELVMVDGTSAAAPVFAAMLSLINSALLSRDASPIGFANPMIYSDNGSSFNDIVMGNNKCPELLSLCCEYGLSAGIGWDATTGFGTPDFEKLSDVFTYL